MILLTAGRRRLVAALLTVASRTTAASSVATSTAGTIASLFRLPPFPTLPASVPLTPISLLARRRRPGGAPLASRTVSAVSAAATPVLLLLLSDRPPLEQLLLLQLLLLQRLLLLQLDDEQAVELERDHERVLAREEDVHVGDEAVVGDQQQAEHEERGVLQDDVDQDAPDVDGAADLLGLLQCFRFLILLSIGEILSVTKKFVGLRTWVILVFLPLVAVKTKVN